MATLNDARDWQLEELGGAPRVVSSGQLRHQVDAYHDAGWERVSYHRWIVPDHVYDLKASYAYLRNLRPRHDSELTRAAGELCACGALIGEAPELPRSKLRRFVVKTIR